ncbi:MAG: hypothetical protein QW279_14890 [Candidatus Jordarchaeaceae archaeon]
MKKASRTFKPEILECKYESMLSGFSIPTTVLRSIRDTETVTVENIRVEVSRV